MPPRRPPARRAPAPAAPQAPAMLACFAVAAPGLEPIVARELLALASLASPAPTAVGAVTGGVECSAAPDALAAMLLHLRVASTVLVRLASFRATAFHELERAARQVEWGCILPPGAPFTLRVTCRKSRLYHSDAVAERIAAAIARAVAGARWDRATDADDEDPVASAPVADAAPPQRFVVRLDRDRCTISADAAGALLHRRGYRRAVAKAPLRETLAAAMLLGTEWDPATPLVDPLCGAGTIAIEAALLARRIAPGLGRGFAAEQWPSLPPGVFARARDTARSQVLAQAAAPIVAVDRDEGAIAAARANAERAGVAADITFRVAALSALEPPPGPGLLLANPPYGIRVGETAPLRDLFARLGQVLRARCPGWRVALLSADATLDGQVRVPFAELLRTRNGGIPVRLIVAEVAPVRRA